MKKGVLLVNLGSPDSPTAKDVKPYLDEFLMDERVIDFPLWFRKILVRGIILRTRPKRSAEAYSKIWTEEGSPLIVISERFQKKVQELVDVPVALGMRYGSGSIKEGFQELVDKGVDDVLLVPLYPHYAMSSFETVVVKAMEDQQQFFPNMKVTTLPAFFNSDDYIKVLSKSITEGLNGFEYDHILFSYHGVPERQIRKTDPTNSHGKLEGECCGPGTVSFSKCYRSQVYATTKMVRENIGLSEDRISSSFQSRLSFDSWLKPFTDKEFERLAKEGKKKLAVVTPAFVCDCLETLEEIAMEGEEQFKEAGGTDFKHIPCLNDRDDWVAVMVKWIKDWELNEHFPQLNMQ